MKLVLPLIASMALLNSGADALNVKIPGVNYTSRKGPPGGDDTVNCKTAAEVQKDMHAIKTVANKVRITSLGDCNQGRLVLAAAKAADLQVHLGIETTKNNDDFVAEKANLTSLFDLDLIGDHVIAVSVGSNSISRGEINLKTAVDYMNEIREDLRSHGKQTLVTIDETIEVYEAAGLLYVTDFASVNNVTYYDKVDVNEGVAVTLDNVRNLRAAAIRSMKRIVFSATGWSSGGKNVNASVSSPENQAKFFSDLYDALTARSIEYYYLEAFDEPWQTKEVDRHFGIFTEDNKMKSSIKALTITPKKALGIRSVAYNMFLSEYALDVFISVSFSLEQQPWLFNAQTQQFISPTSRCLDASQKGDVRVSRCDPTDGNQKWSYDSTTMLLRHGINKDVCLNTDQAAKHVVTLQPCELNNPKQQWKLFDSANP